MRFGLQEGNLSTVQQTLLVNLSETGVAFLTSSNQRFELGDLIMVEIPIPEGEQIAWWARVVRLQSHEPRRSWGRRDKFFETAYTLVACTFEDLPTAHSRALKKGIDRSFLKAMREQRYRTFHYYKTFFMEHVVQLLAYAILCAMAFGLMYYWSRPDENYDAKRGSPWGQRFK